MMKFLCKYLILGIICVYCLFAPLQIDAFSFGRQRGGSEDVKALKQLTVRGVKEGDKKDSLLKVIKGVTNRVLGILTFIALLLALYGGFLMVTSAGKDDTYTKGLSILQSAIIGLIIIGVAWFVISLVLWLIQQSTLKAEGTDGGTG